MPNLDDILTQKLQILEAKTQKRAPVAGFRHDGVMIERAGKPKISFSCNDYLGLSSHPRVVAAASAALAKYGAGAGASRLVTGECSLYAELEGLLASHNGAEAAVVFGSGYLANIGTIPALVGKNDLIIADKLSHACILDGARLSGADVLRFAHNNLAHLRMLLDANRGEYQNCLIITEEVFSMDGDRANVAELTGIAEKYDAWLMVDGAHSLTSSNQQPATIKMGTLSKAAGSYGGYVCGSRALVDYLKTAVRSLIFSTALPPATLAASIEALKIMGEQHELAENALKNASYFAKIMGLPEAESAIVPMILGENENAVLASKALAEKGFIVSAIRPPTVPENTARLRFTFSALHTKQQIEELCSVINGCNFMPEKL